jgi:hypothetical protein
MTPLTHQLSNVISGVTPLTHPLCNAISGVAPHNTITLNEECAG